MDFFGRIVIFANMRRTIILIICVFITGLQVLAQAQGVQDPRKEVLEKARYLKSIFKTDDAIDILSGLVKEDVFDEEVFSELADCHFQGGDYESAAGAYFLLSTRFPGNVVYRVRMMQTRFRMKDFAGSVDAGKAVLQLDSIPTVASLIGDAFRQMEEPDSALLYYRKALSLKPMNETVLSKAVNVLITAKDYDGAISICGPFLAKDPDNTVIAPLKGLSLFRKGEYESAIKVFQRQEDIGNDIYPIHYYLGQSYWQTQVIYRAEKELTAAWMIDSSDVNLAYSIAAVKAEARRSFENEVKPWLDKALDMLQPDDAMMSRIHQQYALGYSRAETRDKAIEHFKEAYRYNPKYITALSSIAYCYELKKDYKQAVLWYERYLKVARPGSRGYDFAAKSVEMLKGELFMQEK